MSSSVQYLRFVLAETHWNTGVPLGPFEAAADLRDNGDTPEYVSCRLRDILEWFNDNLDVPYRFNRAKSKNNDRQSTKGISWFKDNARKHISMMRELMAILAEHGYAIEQIRTQRPGYIVFEDNNQIVAEPFQDTFA